MKSNCPSVAHCALTVAPSCSISRLTSLMRCGLFLTVCTPSGDKVESMMYVGMTAFRRVGRVLPHLVIAVVALGATAATAAAAMVQTSLPCYLENRDVQITG